MHFPHLQKAIAAQFKRLSENNPFRIDIDHGNPTIEVDGVILQATGKDKLWEIYQDSFPPGTNEVFRTRREHDCTCCKQFIRAVGDMVAVIDGKLESIWDVTVPEEPGFNQVVAAMSAFVKAKPVYDVFRHDMKEAGKSRTFEQIVGTTEAKQWNHFHVNIPKHLLMDADKIPAYLGGIRTKKDVQIRGFQSITEDAVETVLELISQKSLYRGEEKLATIQNFQKNQKLYKEALKTGGTLAGEMIGWMAAQTDTFQPIWSDVVGTLLADISEGKDLDFAVKSFETKVSAGSYQRPTAVVTPKMIAAAKETISGLGLTSALERRFAHLNDITVNNILFADRSVKKIINKDVFDDMIAETGPKINPKTLEKVDTVSIADFLSNVLPTAESIEILLEPTHGANMCSLIAPTDPTAGKLFKWDNGFSWSYQGNLADSDMRKAVQARGGSVTGAFRFTHQWNYDKRNASLMDLHVFMPGNTAIKPDNLKGNAYGNGERVGWNNRTHDRSGGTQDVDYVNPAPIGYVPVENITFPDLGRMPEGRYICKIHNWELRQPTQGGFKAEIEFAGQVFAYEYDKALAHKEWITVAEIFLKNGTFEIKHHLEPGGISSKDIWSLPTQTFHRVKTVMFSPNHWDGQTGHGNKHYFFMLDGAQNPEEARGFYNEFLRGDLAPHRKVFEMVGSRMKAEKDPEQLSGLGISSTTHPKLTVRVKGKFQRVLNIQF